MRGSARRLWHSGTIRVNGDDHISDVRGKLAVPSLPLFGLDRWGRCSAGAVYMDGVGRGGARS